MKKTLTMTGRNGNDEVSNHERNKRVKSERDRRVRKALRHPRYAEAQAGWERYVEGQ